MKYRTSFWLKKEDVDYVRKIYPIYGAKNLSALINGLLHYFAYGINPPDVDVRRLLTDALAGKVYVENPEILRADRMRNDFLSLVSEYYEETMLEQLCVSENFLSENEALRMKIISKMRDEYEQIITDEELDALFSMWKTDVRNNGKYREAYGEYNQHRIAAVRAKMED